jgi:hypothetical protein
VRINSVNDFQVGDIGFCAIGKFTGAGIALGQNLVDMIALLRGQRSQTTSWTTHTWMVLDVPGDGTALIGEAMPGGYRLVWVEDYGVGKNASRIGTGYAYVRLPLDVGEKVDIESRGPKLKGTPYSFLDYLSIALLHLGLPRTLLRNYITSSQHMICSQANDYLLCLVGYHVFTDGRLSQDVTPGALFWAAGAQGEVIWW